MKSDPNTALINIRTFPVCACMSKKYQSLQTMAFFLSKPYLKMIDNFKLRIEYPRKQKTLSFTNIKVSQICILLLEINCNNSNLVITKTEESQIAIYMLNSNRKI